MAAEPGQLGVIDPVLLSLGEIRHRFQAASAPVELRNPHRENRVSVATRERAIPSAVMVLITEEAEPQVVLTKRQQGIRFPGHMCFPGGRADPGESPVTTALRESHEEIGLRPSDVEVLGSYGHYYTQAGFRIDPIVGIIRADYEFEIDPAEVASLHYAKLQDVLDPRAYELTAMNAERAYFGFNAGGQRVGGPTVSLMIGLLEWLDH